MLTYKINHIISQERADFINHLFKLTDKEIYGIYGYRHGETIIESAVFPDNTQINVILVICENDTPHAEAAMVRDGHEICRTAIENSFIGTWTLEYEDSKYIVDITSA